MSFEAVMKPVVEWIADPAGCDRIEKATPNGSGEVPLRFDSPTAGVGGAYDSEASGWAERWRKRYCQAAPYAGLVQSGVLSSGFNLPRMAGSVPSVRAAITQWLTGRAEAAKALQSVRTPRPPTTTLQPAPNWRETEGGGTELLDHLVANRAVELPRTRINVHLGSPGGGESLPPVPIAVREFWLENDIHYFFSYDETIIGEIGFSNAVPPVLRTEIIGRILPYKVGKIFRPNEYARKPPPILEPPVPLQELLMQGAKELPPRTAKIFPGDPGAIDVAKPSSPIVVTIREFESPTDIHYLIFRDDELVTHASYDRGIPKAMREKLFHEGFREEVVKKLGGGDWTTP